MLHELRAADTLRSLALLRDRPLHNVFLEHVVRSGALGRIAGFFGYEVGDRLTALLMLGPSGGVSLEVRADEAFEPLARCVSQQPVRARHIVGHEDVTVPFWEAYGPQADELIWTRREPLYVLEADALEGAATAAIEPAAMDDLEAIVENSRAQHIEDIHEDRYLADPDGFRRRHQGDLRDGRWWVLRQGGRIAFQAHVGPRNDRTIQVGGVFTPPDLRERGLATAGMRALSARLLDRHRAVSLFCDERNGPARRVYERVGFRVAFHYRSYLLRVPVPVPLARDYL